MKEIFTNQNFKLTIANEIKKSIFQSMINILWLQYILKILMRQTRGLSDKKQSKTLEGLMAYRSHSKQAMNRIKQVYQSRRLYQPIITGIRIKTQNTSPAPPPHHPHPTEPTPQPYLRIKIPIKSRTPNTKSPIGITKRSPHKQHPLPLTARPPQLEQLKRKHTDIKINFKLNGTQKYFRRQKQKPNKAQISSLNQTLKMVWEMKPKRSSKIQFRMIRELGKSQAGEIIQAASNITGMVAAIKTFRKNQLKLEFLIDEIKIHLFCQHPNILPAYGYHIGKDEVYLVMEVGQCNLYDKLIRFAPFDQPLVANYISQVTSGVAYLHEAGVMHRDIKPENIICFGDCLKIADFGWSIRAARPRKTLCGTLDYLSPEVSKREYYNNKIDCWSIGVLMYELLTGQPPFPDQKDEMSNFEQVNMPKKLSAAGKDLLARVLEVDPVDRLTAKEILEHEWIVKNKRRYEEQQQGRFAALIQEAQQVLF